MIARLIDALEQVCEFRGRDDVRSFLSDHPDLLTVVVDALATIPRYFDGVQRSALEVLRDIEDDTSPGALFLVIRTQLEPEQALTLLEDLRRQWLIAVARETRGRFNVSLEYVA